MQYLPKLCVSFAKKIEYGACTTPALTVDSGVNRWRACHQQHRPSNYCQSSLYQCQSCWCCLTFRLLRAEVHTKNRKIRRFLAQAVNGKVKLMLGEQFVSGIN